MNQSIIVLPLLHKSLEVTIFSDNKDGNFLVDYENYLMLKQTKFLLSSTTKIYKEGD